MIATVRWQGPQDPVPLSAFHNFGISGIVSDLMSAVPTGELLTDQLIAQHQRTILRAGYTWLVVESLPVHPSILLGLPGSREYLAKFIENMRLYANAGIKIITINTMGVIDWSRCDGVRLAPDGGNYLYFDSREFREMDPFRGSGKLAGWTMSYTGDELRALFARYGEIGREGLWRNVEDFLRAVAPAAQELGVRIAIHPDDPSVDIEVRDGEYGQYYTLPRIMIDEPAYRRAIACGNGFGDSIGICFCVGSLASNPANKDIPTMAAALAPWVYFGHFRDIAWLTEDDAGMPIRGFTEIPHDQIGVGRLKDIVLALSEAKFAGPWRCDHGGQFGNEAGHRGYWREGRRRGTLTVSSWLASPRARSVSCS